MNAGTRILFLTALAAGLTCHASPAEAQVRTDLVYRKVVPLVEWNDTLVDPSLRASAPQSNVIADAEAWQSLWKAWRGSEEVPRVDFDQAVVLVYTAHGPNLPLARLYQLRPGQLLVEHGQTLRGGPGFGYRMLLMRRDDVKTIDGQPLSPDEKAVTGESP